MKNTILGTLGLLSAFFIQMPSVKAETLLETMKPHSTMAQNAAYVGYLAAGVGYEWYNTIGLDFLFGYSPPEIAGRAVQSYDIKTSIYLFDIPLDEYIVRPYVGLGILYSPDGGLFVNLPRQYPRYYYPPSAIRPAFTVGFDVKINETMRIGTEYSVLDSELAYYRDTFNFSPSKMGSGGFTFRWLID